MQAAEGSIPPSHSVHLAKASGGPGKGMLASLCPSSLLPPTRDFATSREENRKPEGEPLNQLNILLTYWLRVLTNWLVKRDWKAQRITSQQIFIQTLWMNKTAKLRLKKMRKRESWNLKAYPEVRKRKLEHPTILRRTLDTNRKTSWLEKLLNKITHGNATDCKVLWKANSRAVQDDKCISSYIMGMTAKTWKAWDGR